MSSGARSPPMASSGDRHAHGRALLLVNRSDLAPAVVAAVAAHGVRALRLMALRALADGGRPQRVVRAPLGRARFRVSSFGIRHRPSSLGRRAGRVLAVGARAAGASAARARVDPLGPARARLAVAIHPAHRTQPAAIVAAQRLHRQRQKKLLPNDLAQVQHFVAYRTTRRGHRRLIASPPSRRRRLRRLAAIGVVAGRKSRSRANATGTANGSRQRLHVAFERAASRPFMRTLSPSFSDLADQDTGATRGSLGGRRTRLAPAGDRDVRRRPAGD